MRCRPPASRNAWRGAARGRNLAGNEHASAGIFRHCRSGGGPRAGRRSRPAAVDAVPCAAPGRGRRAGRPACRPGGRWIAGLVLCASGGAAPQPRVAPEPGGLRARHPAHQPGAADRRAGAEGPGRAPRGARRPARQGAVPHPIWGGDSGRGWRRGRLRTKTGWPRGSAPRAGRSSLRCCTAWRTSLRTISSGAPSAARRPAVWSRRSASGCRRYAAPWPRIPRAAQGGPGTARTPQAVAHLLAAGRPPSAS